MACKRKYNESLHSNDNDLMALVTRADLNTFCIEMKREFNKLQEKMDQEFAIIKKNQNAHLKLMIAALAGKLKCTKPENDAQHQNHKKTRVRSQSNLQIDTSPEVIALDEDSNSSPPLNHPLQQEQTRVSLQQKSRFSLKEKARLSPQQKSQDYLTAIESQGNLLPTRIPRIGLSTIQNKLTANGSTSKRNPTFPLTPRIASSTTEICFADPQQHQQSEENESPVLPLINLNELKKYEEIFDSEDKMFDLPQQQQSEANIVVLNELPIDELKEYEEIFDIEDKMYDLPQQQQSEENLVILNELPVDELKEYEEVSDSEDKMSDLSQQQQSETNLVILNELPVLPLINLDELKEYERMFDSQGKMSDLVVQLRKLSANKPERFITLCWKRIMHDELAQNLCWNGTATKSAVKNLNSTIAIKEAFIQKYKDASDQQFEKVTISYFHQAKTRLNKYLQYHKNKT